MGYEILLLDGELGVARCGPVIVNIFYTAPTVPVLDRVGEVERTAFDGARHVVLSIIDPRVGREMGRDARHRAKQLGEEMEALTIANCFLVLGSGFFAALARSVIASVQLLTRTRTAWKVLSTRDEAVAYVAGILAAEDKTVDGEALAAAIDVLQTAPAP